MIAKKVFLTNLEVLLRLLKKEISSEKSSLQDLYLKFTELKNSRETIKSSIELTKKKGIPAIGKVPVIGRPFKRKYIKQLDLMIAEYKKTSEQLKKLKSSSEHRNNVVIHLVNDGKSLQENAKIILDQYDRLPPEFVGEITRFINKTEYLRRSSIKNLKKEIHDIIIRFNVKVSELNLATGAAVDVKDSTKKPKASSDTVYLPIPIELRHEAKRLGAKYNPSGGYGSRMYISLSEDKDAINNLQSLLPIAYRNKHETFAFPPIRQHGKRQNLWSVFTKETWNYIRSVMYARSGNRCMICGNQGGKLIDSVYEDDKHKKTAVECHEIWEWDAPDLSTGVGIQRLKQIMVLCVDCHMMFHEDFAAHKARDYGKSDEVRDFLRKRMMLVNHMNESQIVSSLQTEKLNAERMNGVDTWILDLSSLAEQDYMKHHIPVLAADNEAGLTPDLIAGIEFEDETGLIYEAEDAVEIYSKIVSGITQELEATAMPFEQNNKPEQTKNIQLKMF